MPLRSRALLRSCSIPRHSRRADRRRHSGIDANAEWSRAHFAHTRRNKSGRAMIALAILRWTLAHDLGETRTERSKRQATNLVTGFGDRGALPQQRHRPLDSPSHQVLIRSLAIRRTELPGEMPRRHQRPVGQRRHTQPLPVIAIHEIASPTQTGEVRELFGRHAVNATGDRWTSPPGAQRSPFSPSGTTASPRLAASNALSSHPMPDHERRRPQRPHPRDVGPEP